MTFNLNLLSKPTVRQLSSQVEENENYIKAAENQENLYKSPNGYLHWNVQLRACFMSGTTEVAIRGYTGRDILAVKVGELAREIILHQAPARYITKEMCEAFRQTPIPVLSKEILEILPWMHIMLPRNFIYDHAGDEVVSLLVHCGVLYPEDIPHEDLGRKVVKEFFPGEIETPPEYFGASGIQVATITPEGSNFWQEFIDKDAKSWQEEHIKQRENSGYDNEKTEEIIRIAINSLLVHLYEPELITTDAAPKFSSGAGFGKGLGKSPLGPTWIGKGFRYQREKTKPLGGQEQAKASVRAHWRRGHWHTILHGKGKQERRVQWFKPVFVGSSTS
jgi:hypothetical protein